MNQLMKRRSCLSRCRRAFVRYFVWFRASISREGECVCVLSGGHSKPSVSISRRLQQQWCHAARDAAAESSAATDDEKGLHARAYAMQAMHMQKKASKLFERIRMNEARPSVQKLSSASTITFASPVSRYCCIASCTKRAGGATMPMTASIAPSMYSTVYALSCDARGAGGGRPDVHREVNVWYFVSRFEYERTSGTSYTSDTTPTMCE